MAIQPRPILPQVPHAGAVATPRVIFCTSGDDNHNPQPLELMRIADVPDDQGLAVQLTWSASAYDAASTPADTQAISLYGIWRRGESIYGRSTRNDATARSPIRFDLASASARAGDAHLPPGTRIHLQGEPYAWDLVATVPAERLATYTQVVPTQQDSLDHQPNWQFFMVSAHTADQAYIFISYPDSGYSIDNLPPVVRHARAEMGPLGVQLSWETPGSPDIVMTRVYRRRAGAPATQGSELIGIVDGHAFHDPAGTETTAYRLEVEDDGGNVTVAEILPVVVTGIDANPGTPPTEFQLFPNHPNPFNPETEIRYALPRSGRVELVILNVSGQVVRTLVASEQAPGLYRQVWPGRDEFGRSVASGIYLCRLRVLPSDGSPPFAAVRKMALVR